jgi:exopolysaccharide production protein ExoQ
MTTIYMREAHLHMGRRSTPDIRTNAQRAIPRLLEHLFALTVLFMCINGFREVFSDNSDRSAASLIEPGFGFQIFSGTFYLVAVVFILRDFSRFLHLCRHNLALVLLLTIIVMSSAWSVYPLVTLRRASALLLTSAFGAYFAMRFRPDVALKLVAWACCLSAIASVVLAVVDPTAAIHQWDDPNAGAWRGIFGHKNSMGRSMSFGVLTLAVTALVTNSFARLAAMGGTVLCGVLLFLSMSRGGWLTTLLLLLALPLFLLLHPNRLSHAVRFATAAFGAVILLALLALTYKYGLALIGRDETLSGRTHLWDLAIRSGMRHFALGAGYRSFWTENGAMDIFQELTWRVPSVGNGHNGYLDIWLELGAVGFGAFLLVLCATLHRLTRWLMRSPDAIGLWLALTMSYMMIYAITERVLIQHSEITWVILVAVLFWLAPSRSSIYPTHRTVIAARFLHRPAAILSNGIALGPVTRPAPNIRWANVRAIQSRRLRLGARSHLSLPIIRSVRSSDAGHRP